MNKHGIKFMILFLCVVLALGMFLGSCDSSSDSSNEASSRKVTLTIGSNAKVVFKGLDEGVQAYYTVAGVNPIPALSTAVAAMNNTDPDLLFAFTGTTTGTYTIASGNAFFSCSDASGNTYSAQQALTHTSGDIIVTEYGAVGEFIKGTYSVVADPFSGGNPSGSTITITGSFRVKRGSDQ